MSNGPAVIYRYDGTFDGLLTAVFEAYAHPVEVKAITAREELQMGWGQEEIFLPTDAEKARRVEAGILKKIGSAALQRVEVCFWSGEEDKDTALYRYLRAGFDLGRRIYNSLTHPDVLAVEYLYRNITREEQRVQGFTRFSEMENGVYYASIAPKNSLVPLLMPHFADRFSIQPFLLHDTQHAMAGVYDGRGWYLVETDELEVPDVSTREHEFRQMWRQFYDAVAISQRRNHKLRQGMMPKWYWRNMTEFNFRYAPEQRQQQKVQEEEGRQGSDSSSTCHFSIQRQSK